MGHVPLSGQNGSAWSCMTMVIGFAALALIGVALVTATGLGFFIGRRRASKPIPRRWGERLRDEIEDSGGLTAWKRSQAPASSRPSVSLLSLAHPLAGPVETSVGAWTVAVLKDVDDGRTRRFTLRLAPVGQKEEPTSFLVRVPRGVIDVERRDTWPADLREEIARWISVKTIYRGEMIWWPVLAGEEREEA